MRWTSAFRARTTITEPDSRTEHECQINASYSNSDYRPDVDGLRAVAVLAVVGFHAAPDLLPGGFVGVDIFFAISGFLITHIILRDLKCGTFRLASFYARRVRRIFPALAALLLGVWCLGWLALLPHEFAALGKHVLAGAAFGSNIALYNQFDWYFSAPPTPLLHLWSLGVEEQFYLLWPLLLATAGKYFSKRLALIIALVFGLSLLFNLLLIGVDSMASFFLPMGRLWELAAGGGLAYLQHRRSLQSTHTRPKSARSPRYLLHSRDLFAFSGVILLSFCFASFDKQMSFPGWWALVPCSGAILLILAGPKSWFSRHVLARGPLVFIGLISYPLYLWHWPLLVFTRILSPREPSAGLVVTVIIAAFALAWITYKYVEIPIRSFRSKPSVVGILCAIVAVSGGIGYLTYAQVIPARSNSFGLEVFIRASQESFWPPDTRHRYEPLFSEGFLSLGGGARRVVFIGDSNMQQYYPRIEKILADNPTNSRSALFAVRDACALGIEDSEAPTRCGRHLRKAIEYAYQPTVDTVVIGASWYMYLTDRPTFDPLGERVHLSAYSDQALARLERLMSDFGASGRKVFIVLNMPLGVEFDPLRMIDRTHFYSDFRVHVVSPSKEELKAAFQPFTSRLLEIARESGASVIDPLESLCDKGICPAVTEQLEPMYRDSNHLRPSYVRENVRFLDPLILDVYRERDDFQRKRFQ